MLRRRQRLMRRALIYAGLAFFSLILLFPFVWMAVTSIKPDADLYDLRQSPFWLSSVTLEHYRHLFQEIPFTTWLRNSLLVGTVSTGISMLVSVPAAYALSRLRFRGAQTIGLGIFVTYLVPTSLLFIPLAYVVQNLGLYDSIWALVFVYPTFLAPFATWLLIGFFRGVPLELEESAMVDGASRVRALWNIVLPLILPGLVSCLLFAFTLSWNEFIYALTLIQSSDAKTIPVGVVGQLAIGDVLFWGPIMAAALLGSVPIAFIYSFFLDYYVAGLTAGAVKG